MGICVFKTSEIKRIVKHALGSQSFRSIFGQKQCPSIVFVHDDGVYCMSSGLPADLDEDRCFVAYAKGCDPRKDEDFYEESRYLVGGDDFGINFPVTDAYLADCDNYEEMVIRVNTKSMSLGFRKPKKASLKKAV